MMEAVPFSWTKLLPPVVAAFAMLVVTLIPASGAYGDPTYESIRLSPRQGPPTTIVLVRGSGFGAHEGVTIFFDNEKVGVTTTRGGGTFHKRITIPRTALPGTHAISVIGQYGGYAAKPFLVETNWKNFHFDFPNTGYNPYENELGTTNVATLISAWSYPTGGGIVSSPVVAEGVVYVGSWDHKIYALDAETGARRWSYATGGLIWSSPAVANGIVYVASDDGNLYALDATTGSLYWSFPTGSDVTSTPAVAGGVVYVPSRAGLFALDAHTGTLEWSYPVVTNFSSPAVVGGTLYIGSGQDVIALDAASGTLEWSYAAGEFVDAAPSVADGIVYAGSDDDKVYALDAATGSLRWSFTTRALVVSTPAVAHGVVYVGSYDGNMYALDGATGAIEWTSPVGEIGSSPAVANGVVYVGSGANGFPGGGTDLAGVAALDAATGALLWSYSTHGVVSSSPAVVNGMVYVGSQDQSMHAFGLP